MISLIEILFFLLKKEEVNFLLFYIGIICVSRGVCFYVAVNCHDCYIWICK